jgi:myosin heavy subunit
MGKETRREDIIAKNVFSDPQAEAESLLSVIENLEKSFTQLLKTSMELAKKTPLEGFENVSKVNKALEESEENLKQLEKLQEVRIKQVKELEKVEKARLGGLAELQKQLNSLKKEQKELNNQAKKNLVTDNELAKRQSELNLQIKATTKAINEEQKALLETQVTKAKTSKLDSDRIKLEQKLAELTEEQAIENQKLKIELREVNRQNKQAAILASELTTEYEKQGVRLGKLRKEGKDLSLQLRRLEKDGKKNTKEFKELEKQFKETQEEANELADTLEEVDRQFKQQTREIGRYENALNSVNEATKLGSGGILAVVGALTAVASQFSQSREGAQGLEQALSRLTAFFKVFVSSVGDSAKGFQQVFNNIGTSIQIFAKQAQVQFKELTSVFGSGEDDIKKLRDEIKELEKQQEANAGGLDEITKAFDNFGERVDEATEAQQNFIKSTFATEVEIQKLEQSLISLQKIQAESINIANDDTFSFQERAKAFQDAAKANEDVADIETKIAEARLKLARQQVSIELEAAGIRAKTTDQVISALSKESTAIKVSQETAENFQQALIALGQAQIEQADVAFATAEQRRKFVSDVEEKNLDILIDGFDNLKSINERIISNEDETLSKRRAILEETTRLSTESFNKQVETIRSFATQTIQLNDKLSESEKEIQLQKIASADISALVNERDSIALNDRIRQLGLSEIFEGRLLEVIREQRIGRIGA